jgi:outer membrane biosynthesis protein TonB
LAKLLVKTPPQKNPSYKVTVRADGSIAKVELVESCGELDIDELCRLQILRNWTYFPAYVDGKYIEATTDATITLVEK